MDGELHLAIALTPIDDGTLRSEGDVRPWL